MGLSMREFLFGVKVGKVVVVSPHLKGIGVTFEVVAEIFEGMDNGKEFFVVNIVVEFGGLHCL